MRDENRQLIFTDNATRPTAASAAVAALERLLPQGSVGEVEDEAAGETHHPTTERSIMSRSGYHEDGDDQWAHIRWRGMVVSATRGKRGQTLLRDMLAALDAMPEKKLIANDLVATDGCVCALGALGKARGIDMTGIDPENSDQVATTFDIADPLAREIVYVNDEHGPWQETPEHRFERVRRWVAEQIKPEPEQVAA